MTSLLPNPDELAEQLDHVRATQGYLAEVADWLQQGIALVGRANGAATLSPGAPAPEPEAPRELTAPEADPPPDDSRAVAHITIGDDEADDDEPPGSDSPTSLEVPESEPRATDSEPVAPEPPAPAEVARAQVRSAGAPPARLADRDYAAKILSALITSNQPLSRKQIAELAGLTVEQITKPLRELVTAEKVIATGATVSRRYTATRPPEHSEQAAKVKAGTARNAAKLTTAVQKIGLREKVLRAVRSKPGQLTIADLARQLEAVEEDVVEAVAHHAERDQLTCAGDGTYTAAALRAAGPVRS